MDEEFVVFDSHGNEIDWVDPYFGHEVNSDGTVSVENSVHTYTLNIPAGGSFAIRNMSDDE